MEAPASKGPKLRRPGDPPARYGADDDEFTVEINFGGVFRGFGQSKRYAQGKVARFDNCEADTWSPLWLTDFMSQLGYKESDSYLLYWLLPGMSLDKGLRIVDSDKDCLSMIAVVPKFHYFQMFVDHKDANFATDSVIDDVLITGSPVLPPVMSPKYHHKEDIFGNASSSNAGNCTGSEPRRSKRKLPMDAEAVASENEEEDSEVDDDWVDSDNEVAADDDDLFEEWVDEKFEQKKKNKNKFTEGSDYDTDADFEDLQDSDVEEAVSEEEVVVIDKKGKGQVKKKVKLTRWRAEMMKAVEFKIGIVFLNVQELRGALQQYIVQQRVGVHYLKNDRQRIRARCEEGCNWYFFAAPDSRKSTWVIKKYQKHHDCEREYELKQFTAKYLANHYIETFRADDKMSLKNFCRLIEKDFNMTPSRSKLERARRQALKQINGDELQQYNLLWDFAAEVRRSNPGSTVFVNCKDGVFENCYMSLDACKRGFMAGCRPLIGIDGCHIKNRFGGVMLAAVGVDANDCIFPLAIAIVEVEDTVTWKWFLQTLKDDLAIENTRPWTFMSDRQKGLINAVNAIWPDASHRFCVRHLHQNFAKQGWRGDIFKNKLWQIARASRMEGWQKHMEEMKTLDQEAFEYLDAIDPRYWCKAFFEELPKCDLLLNNICEVFNKYILDARELPIVTCLKKIKDQLMTRFYTKNKEVEDMAGTICPKIRKKLDKNIDWANNYNALPAAEHLFKVMGLYGEYEVHIKKMKCSCRIWQLTGIPCRHACACLRHERIKPETVVHKCYSISAFKQCYGQVIMPCADPRIWRKTNGPAMTPPKYDKQVGRPSKKRRKSPLEEEEGTRLSRHGMVGHCSSCNQTGHNKRRCPALGRGAVANIAVDPIIEDALPLQQEANEFVQEDAVPAVTAVAQEASPDDHELEPEPIQVVLPVHEPAAPVPRKKLPIKSKSSNKKAAVKKAPTSSFVAPSYAASSATYDMATSTVMDILQDQQIAGTQQSQTSLPSPMPESQFIASCRDDLPPPRPSTATFGLKRRKKPDQKKENILPK